MAVVRKSLLLVFFALTLVAWTPARGADCDRLKNAFDAAVAARSAASILTAADNVQDDVSCGFDVDEYVRREMDGLIDAAAASGPGADREAALSWVDQHLTISGNWRNAEKLGEYYDRSGDRADAYRSYEVALSLASQKPRFKLSDVELKTLALRAAAGKLLASNDDEGRNARSLALSARNADGSVGGIYSLLRAVVVDKIPLPINFEFGTTEMTPAGREAVKELAAAVTEQEISGLRLIGHADPRGDARFNVDLSQRRAREAASALQAEIERAHADYLSGHPMPRILTDGRGASEPFDVSVLSYVPSKEEVYALDRRVQFQIVNP